MLLLHLCQCSPEPTHLSTLSETSNYFVMKNYDFFEIQIFNTCEQITFIFKWLCSKKKKLFPKYCTRYETYNKYNNIINIISFIFTYYITSQMKKKILMYFLLEHTKICSFWLREASRCRESIYASLLYWSSNMVGDFKKKFHNYGHT